ncbi:acetate--CoA ligase family protein [Streptomyces sp. NBC_01012]|uniref:acetate--CoA ligase family protein n=1 Tax=Streptomyces sp. NBC_01012 TaxID=2903717 RepID=UPI003869AFF7|nr:acetate--CoA ligase family protein [Streptomyces sp. NBC_01012]
MTGLPPTSDRRLREDVVRDLAIRYGIPANPVVFADTPVAAGEIAERLGKPLAIKLVADGVVHKSKAGGVLLDIAPDAAEAAVKQLFTVQRARGFTPRGVTVEPMVDAGPEVVVGALHDPGFGPVVMVGSGGVDVEALGDVAFAQAPLDRDGALRLIGRTRIGSVLRRRFPAGHEQLADLLVRVGGAHGLLLSEPVDQIDLNPVVVGPTSIVAVDARAVARPDGVDVRAPLPDPATLYRQLKPAVYPTSMAVVGASAHPEKMGHRAVRTAVDQGFTGALHPVSRSADTILGHAAVSSIAELPEGVDRAVVALPAAAVPQALTDLAGRGVKTAHVLTAGTTDLAQAVAGTELRVLGPNCIGHYTPYSRLTMIGRDASSTEKGTIAVVSQSGTYAGDVVRRGNELGLRFSFVSSVGNCHDVSPSELLAFCEADPDTTVAAFYLEDDSDARDFFALAATMSTPVILFKGGRSAVGGAAAASHTGALAGDPQLLRDAAADAGVVLVSSLDELMDTLLLAQFAPGFTGPGLGLLGTGGGVAVVGADTAHESGLVIPPFAGSTDRSLSRYDAPGSSLHNPIDIPTWSMVDDSGAGIMGRLVEAVAADPAVDCIVAYTDMGTVYDMKHGSDAAAMLTDMARDISVADRGPVPVVLVLRSSYSAEQDTLVRALRAEAASAGVAVIETVDRAITALGHVRRLNARRS